MPESKTPIGRSSMRAIVRRGHEGYAWRGLARRLALLAVLAAALAAGAASALAKTPFTTQAGTQAMDDGVQIAWTLREPEGAAPAGGWPAVIVLHGLAGTKETVSAIAEFFASEGYAVLAYDARGHGASGGNVELASAREVADLRALHTT